MTLIQTRLNPRLAKKAQAAADREGLSMAAWVRRLVQAHLEVREMPLKERLDDLETRVIRLELETVKR